MTEVPSIFTPPSTVVDAVGNSYGAGIVGLFRICATPEAAFQSEFTCAAGIVGLFFMKSAFEVSVSFQSDWICASPPDALATPVVGFTVILVPSGLIPPSTVVDAIGNSYGAGKAEITLTISQLYMFPAESIQTIL